jgi:hypothetical protein
MDKRRVIAISHSEGNKVFIFGYGYYVGDEVPTTAGGFMGEMVKESGITNPKIELDNGKVVWGCECWWGDVESAKKMMDDREVVEIDIDEERKKQ